MMPAPYQRGWDKYCPCSGETGAPERFSNTPNRLWLEEVIGFGAFDALMDAVSFVRRILRLLYRESHHPNP